jgi:UDP-N-acetylmuramate--alanine ligase
MISVLLENAKFNPSFVIGVGAIFPLGVAGHYATDGEYFVCEADDYVVSPGVDDTPKFMLLNPFITIVTNIEYDHPDVYKTFDETKTAFKKFFDKIPEKGKLIACIDNVNVTNVIRGLKKPLLTYGLNPAVDYQIKNIKFKDQKTYFDLFLRKEKKTYKDLIINAPGEYNVRNATAAFITGNILGIGEEDIRKGLSKYHGCRRRFEKMGEYGGALFYDDYAHHPSEVISTLKAAKDWFPKKRLIVIFQPHTFSRTKALFTDFSKAFKNADIVGFMDIYASARESFDATISSELLCNETLKHRGDVYYLGKHEITLKWLDKNIKRGDIVLTLGAGDIFHLYNNIKTKP